MREDTGAPAGRVPAPTGRESLGQWAASGGSGSPWGALLLPGEPLTWWEGFPLGTV